MIGTSGTRLDAPDRIAGVDIARGLAVVGMFAAHLLVTPRLQWGDPGSWLGVVDGRSSILFATLAGVSLALTTPRDASPHVLRRARLRIAARAIAVWFVGVLIPVLTTVPVFVILPAYGVLFVVATGLLGLSIRSLLATAAALAVTTPFLVALVNGSGPTSRQFSMHPVALLTGWHYPFPVWVAFVAAGLAAGRLLAARSPSAAGSLVAGGGAAAILGYGVLGPIGERVTGDATTPVGDPGTLVWALSVLQSGPHSSGVGEVLGSGGFALAVVGLCTWVGATGLGVLLWPVRAVGSMPLTAYVAHLLVWEAWIVSARLRGLEVNPLADFRALAPFWPMTVGITLFCCLWTLRYGRGPLERGVSAWTRAVAAAAPTAVPAAADGCPLPCCGPARPDEGRSVAGRDLPGHDEAPPTRR